MTDAKDPILEEQPQDRATRSAGSRLIVSAIVLALFWGALLYDYWPALVPALLRLFNSARSVGAETIESQYFEVHNNSNASEAQIRRVVKTLEQQYEAISTAVKTKPESKLPILVVNGRGPAVIDGAEIVLSYDNGLIDINLAPLYLAIMIQGIPIDPAGELVPAGGQALQVVEAAGLGGGLIRQPLDAWAVLLRQNSAYVPLEEAWTVSLPNDDEGYYLLLRALLENGSFMGWFTKQYGLDAAQRVARGETVETVSGKPIAENETKWLQWLDQQKIQPKTCAVVIPRNSLFQLLCRKLRGAYNRPAITSV